MEYLIATLMKVEKVRPATLSASGEFFLDRVVLETPNSRGILKAECRELKEKYPRLWLAILPIKIGGYGYAPTAPYYVDDIHLESCLTKGTVAHPKISPE